MLVRQFATGIALSGLMTLAPAFAQTQQPSGQPIAATVQPVASPVGQIDIHAPDYRSGLTDGCLHATNGMRRNETRFDSDMLYRAGWLKGFDNCYPHQTIHSNGDPNGPMGKNLY